MQIIIKGRNIELTPALRAYVEEKIHKIDRYFDKGTKIEVELSVEKNPSISDNQTIEVSVFANHSSNIRAKQSTPDMYASVDAIIDKLGTRLKKYKEKLDSQHSKHHKETIRNNGFDVEFEEAEEVEADGPLIVKTKQFTIKPMSLDEAAMEMEMLGHNFFFFTNSLTDVPNVIYKRKDGNLGLIEPTK